MDVIMVRFYRDVAKRMGELLKETGAERVIVGGSEAVANALTEYLIRDKLIPALVGVVEIPLQETDRQVMKHILPTALNYERRQEVNLINGVLDHARAGRAVLRRDAVEAAAKDGAIATLYATWPVEPTGLTDPIYGQVVAAGGTVELVRGEAARTLKLEAEGWAARLNPQR
jgi:hypothetical protein